ncbi:glycosyltransferase [Runella slithyformis]|uniref:Glycosyl transferase group 1 n=1 Tax=Runella slithyformis (strain ATCC 29530 / DSM 19594 / LMG 11500 / NCIMB 11436 / LSU 4) TaxID=761193 RepID=A0A7U3ZGX4_RUNSL|nr:glycosyltransferase [Runella slithyformis]AEI47016.1 glycosyl transferase group 1 [Runella slithyformis DSM 19594]
MRILNICAYTWAIGGPARIIYDHTTVVLKQGHQVDILSPASPGDKIYPAPEGARVIVCERTRPISRFFPEFSSELWHFLKTHIHEYDVVHCHGIWHFGSVAPFLFKHNTPIAVTIHGLLDKWALNHGYWKKRLFGLLFQKRFLRKADFIQINNRDELNDLRQFLGVQHPNVAIIPNGMQLAELADLPPKSTFRAKFNLPGDKKLVLFMGRLNIKKGLDLLLPAFKKYTEHYDDALLILAGPDDGYQAETERFIEQYQLQEKMVMVGMLTGELKKAALADATIFALPSYSEGFSIAALEAMTAGVPALVSDRIGFDGTVAQHRAAHEVPLTVEGVYEGLEKLLQQPEYANALRLNARKMVETLYDIEIVATNLSKEFEKIVRKK